MTEAANDPVVSAMSNTLTRAVSAAMAGYCDTTAKNARPFAPACAVIGSPRK